MFVNFRKGAENRSNRLVAGLKPAFNMDTFNFDLVKGIKPSQDFF